MSVFCWHLNLCPFHSRRWDRDMLNSGDPQIPTFRHMVQHVETKPRKSLETQQSSESSDIQWLQIAIFLIRQVDLRHLFVGGALNSVLMGFGHWGHGCLVGLIGCFVCWITSHDPQLGPNLQNGTPELWFVQIPRLRISMFATSSYFIPGCELWWGLDRRRSGRKGVLTLPGPALPKHLWLTGWALAVWRATNLWEQWSKNHGKVRCDHQFLAKLWDLKVFSRIVGNLWQIWRKCSCWRKATFRGEIAEYRIPLSW